MSCFSVFVALVLPTLACSMSLLCQRKPDAQIEREALEGFVAERFDLHKGRYGYRRINRELRRDGIVVSEKRVLSVMRKPGPQAKGASRKRKRAKAVEMGDPRANLVDRAFDVEARNKPWAGGIACIGTGEGLPCLATVIDALRRRVVGWSMSGRMTEKPVADALEHFVRAALKGPRRHARAERRAAAGIGIDVKGQVKPPGPGLVEPLKQPRGLALDAQAGQLEVRDVQGHAALFRETGVSRKIKLPHPLARPFRPVGRVITTG